MFLKKPSSHVIQAEQKKQPAPSQTKPSIVAQAPKEVQQGGQSGMRKLGPSNQAMQERTVNLPPELESKIQSMQADPWLQIGDKGGQMHPYLQGFSMGPLQKDNPTNRSGYLDIAMSLANAIKQR